MKYTITGQYLKVQRRTSRKTGEDYWTMYFLAGWEGDDTPQVLGVFPTEEVPITAVDGLDAFEDVVLVLSESESKPDSAGRTFKNYRLHELRPVEVKGKMAAAAGDSN